MGKRRITLAAMYSGNSHSGLLLHLENNPAGEYDKNNECERRFPIEDIFYDNQIKLDPQQLNSTRKQPGFKSPFTCEELDTILSGLHLPDIEIWFEQLDWSPHKRDGWEPENYSGSDC